MDKNITVIFLLLVSCQIYLFAETALPDNSEAISGVYRDENVSVSYNDYQYDSLSGKQNFCVFVMIIPYKDISCKGGTILFKDSSGNELGKTNMTAFRLSGPGKGSKRYVSLKFPVFPLDKDTGLVLDVAKSVFGNKRSFLLKLPSTKGIRELEESRARQKEFFRQEQREINELNRVGLQKEALQNQKLYEEQLRQKQEAYQKKLIQRSALNKESQKQKSTETPISKTVKKVLWGLVIGLGSLFYLGLVCYLWRKPNETIKSDAMRFAPDSFNTDGEVVAGSSKLRKNIMRKPNKENWEMNNNQKKCLLVAMTLVLIMGLVPPWVCEKTKRVYSNEWRYTTEPGSYSFIAVPPARAKFVDLYRLGVQFFVVAVVTAGLMVTLAGKKEVVKNTGLDKIQRNTKKCTSCNEDSPPDSIKCIFCGESFGTADSDTTENEN